MVTRPFLRVCRPVACPGAPPRPARLVGLLATVSAVLVRVATARRRRRSPGIRGGGTAARGEARHPRRHRRPHLERRQREVDPRAVVAAAGRLDGGDLGALGVHQHLPDRRLAEPCRRATVPQPPDRGKNGARSHHRPVPARSRRSTAGSVPGWDGYVKVGDRQEVRLDARALLGETLAANKQCVQAVGPGAGGGRGATRPARSPRYADYDAAKLTGLLTACRGDAGRRRRGARPRGRRRRVRPTTAAGRDRATAGRRDRRPDRRGPAAAPSGADIIVASLSDAGGSSERLRLVAAKGPQLRTRHAQLALDPPAGPRPVRRPHRRPC